MTNGGWTAGDSQGTPLLVGAAVGILSAPDNREFGKTINLAWATPTEDAPVGKENWPVAQLTLANNTNGTIDFKISANGHFLANIPVPVVNGIICIPEPSTVALFGIAFASLAAVHWPNIARRRWR